MKRWAVLISFLLLGTLSEASEPLEFDHVKIHRHRSLQDRVLVDKSGTLTFDDAGQKLSFVDEAGDELEVRYDAVTQVVLEVTTHMRGGALAQAITAAGVPGMLVGNQIAGKHVHAYWFYLEYKNADKPESVLLEVPKNSSAEVIDKTTSVFGSRATIRKFPETGEEVDGKQLGELRFKHSLKVDKKNHPLPETKPDKATVVVVCPPLAARNAGHGNQDKLHANDHVILVNRAGTYSFTYLEPGRYRLISQSENANGFEMDLEAGKTYYFLQNTFLGSFGGQTMLSHNSAELVTYLMDGSYFSDWKFKGTK